MASNYNILLESEKTLKRLVVEYLVYIKHIHVKLWNEVFKNENELKSTDTIPNELNDSLYRRLDHAEGINTNLVDECIWTISKDSPRANHLRFIITVIQAAKDLERAGQYGLTISKAITRRKIQLKNLQLLKPFIEEYLSIFDNFISLYNSSGREKMDAVEKIWEGFSDFEHNFSKNLRKQFKSEASETLYFPISIVTKAIESTIERIKGIFHSTKYVKQNTVILDLENLND